MAYNIVVGGGSVYSMTTAGVATALTLPTGVSVSSTRPSRMAVIGRNIVIVNGPNRSLFIDPIGVVRPMQLTPPTSPVIVSGTGSSTLSGTFKVKYTYITKDPLSGALLLESDFSPESATVTLTSQLLLFTGLGISPDAATTHRRMYRTTTGPGTVYYHWFDVDGNTITTGSDGMSDASLALIAAPTELGTAPGAIIGTYMTLIKEWKGRLWGVGDNAIDTLRYSGNGLLYGWPATYGLTIAPVGNDQYGITGLLPRRDELGVARRDYLWRVIHNGTNSDGTPNYDVRRVHEGKGVYGPDTVIIIDDVAYFLAEDGVYTWGPSGIECISDRKVRKWFATDTYFNRSLYPSCFANYNATYHTYELHLAAAGSSSIDRWVSYDIAGKKWLGPHKTDAFTPSASGVIVNASAQHVPVIAGTNGFVYLENQSTFGDAGSAINMSALSKLHDGNTPDIMKLFKEMSFQNKRQSSKGNWQVAASLIQDRDDLSDTTPTVAKTYTMEMQKNRQLTSNVGNGRMLQLEFTEDTLDLGCEIYGYEVEFHELGRRNR